MQGIEKDLNPRAWKKKITNSKVSMQQVEGDEILGRHQMKNYPQPKTGQKGSKRNSASPLLQHADSDSLPDSASDNNYRALRRKYLLLEEESFTLGKELKEVEDEVSTLEDEKLGLLDQLVVLEGLVDPSKR